MPALNFKKEFSADVRSGKKSQTIRPKRKNPIKPGDPLYLYSGMRTKHCEKLREAKALKVVEISIGRERILLNGKQMSRIGADQLAIKDGFDGLGSFLNFFEKQYSLPFTGDLITW